MTLTFHNDPVQKIKYMTLYQNARESGHLMRGDYFDPLTHKGCLIGLATHGSHHAQYAEESGIPKWLLRTGEIIFEGLPEDKFEGFPEKLIDSIPVGISHNTLEVLKHELALYQLTDICCNTDHPIVKGSIDNVKTLHRRFIARDFPSQQEWSSAYSAAYSAANSAYSAANSARSAAYSAASAAYSAYSAYSAADAADSAAYSAADAADSANSAYSAADSADSAAYYKISKKLIALLKALQPVQEKSLERMAE